MSQNSYKKTIKELHLRYDLKDFERMKKIKEEWAVTWETLMFMAVTSLK